MAGDWIKMREDLHEDPSVLWIAQQLDVRPETVVGMCHRFWGLVSRQTGDGCLKGPTLLSLGCVLGLPGFPELLVQVGWLEYDESDPLYPITTIPKFQRHLSESAKNRALAAEKKRLQRASLSPETGDKCPSETGTRGEKRRVRRKKHTKKECAFVPPSLSDIEEYATQTNYPMNAKAFIAFYTQKGWKVGTANMTDWRAAVDHWKENGWGVSEDGNGEKVLTPDEFSKVYGK